MRQPLREHLPRRLVADRPPAQLLQDLGDLVRGYPPLPGAAGHDQGLGGRPDVGPHRPLQHRGQPRVALEDGHLRRVDAADRVSPATSSSTVVWRTSTSPRAGSTAPMWSRKARLGPTTSTPAPEQPVAERVEQPRRPVQADRGLAGPRRPLHAYRRRGIGADDLVLLRLDRGDDVAHRADARSLDLVDEDLAAPDVARLGGDEVLVLVGGEPSVVHAEPAAQPHAHRGGRERPGRTPRRARPASR